MLRLMSRRGSGAVAAILCAGLAATAATVHAALPGSARISSAGLGPVTIGMTVKQVEQAAGRELDFEGGDVDAECASAALGTKVYGLFSKGRLARVDVRTRTYAARTGVRVGDTQAKLVASYGPSLKRSPHKFVRGGSYFKLTVGTRRLVFETDAKRRVTQIGGGRKPEIDYVEGCA